MPYRYDASLWAPTAAVNQATEAMSEDAGASTESGIQEQLDVMSEENLVIVRQQLESILAMEGSAASR